MIIGITGGTASDRERLTGVMQAISWSMAYSSWELMTPWDQQYKWRIKRFDSDLLKRVSFITDIIEGDLQKVEIKWNIRKQWDIIASQLRGIGESALMITLLNKEYVRSFPSKFYTEIRGSYPYWIIPDVRTDQPLEVDFVLKNGGILIHLEKVEPVLLFPGDKPVENIHVFSEPDHLGKAISLAPTEGEGIFQAEYKIQYTGTISDFNEKIRACVFLKGVLQNRGNK